ncbi:MAG: diacylglycerol kinase family protein, partial [Aureliella sp.]
MECVRSHVLIAANPKSGSASGRRSVIELREALVSAGYACDVHYSLDELRCSATRFEALGELRAVVSAGGDGTASALANLLPSQVPLLLFPLGTENLLAKHLGITGNVRQARNILRADQRTMLDVGRANGRLFLVMLSCGFDAEVVRKMHAVRTGHIT